jgi:hypothetical protein
MGTLPEEGDFNLSDHTFMQNGHMPIRRAEAGSYTQELSCSTVSQACATGLAGIACCELLIRQLLSQL